MKRKAKKAVEATEVTQEKRPVCQYCGSYCAKKCGVTGKYTARKNSCEKFKEVN